ncbi:hypothetical protein MPH_04090 [Macrophomina phaseolina MS6]|uniref:Uncharacterized protein n=1 Tax=Macrophomina phaseolina (strain MS6) TaxID=1126212 RepID=K2S105_MACPH|nr:hypothetical protein MPH_04090 [Macrophomina phaseolina MS6]
MRDREAARVHGTCLRRRHSFDDWLGWETTAALPGRPQGVHVRNEAMHKRWLDFAEHHGIHVASDCPPAAIAGAPGVAGPCRAARGQGGGLGENQEEYAPADGAAEDLNEVGDGVDSGVEVEEKAQDEAVTPAEGGSIQAEQGDSSDSDGLYNLSDDGEQDETDGRKCKKTEDQKEAQDIFKG